MVRVICKNEEYAKVLKHPLTKVGFADTSTSVNWPDDAFTKRRIKDGDVVVEDSKKATHQRHHRHDESAS